VIWGILALLFLLGGGVASFLTRIWKVHCGLAAAAFGIVLFAAVQLSSAAGSFGANVQSPFGGAAVTARAGLAWGIWYTLLASGLAAGAAYAAGAPAVVAWLKGLDRSVVKKGIVLGCGALCGLLLLVLVRSGAVPLGSGSGGPGGGQSSSRPTAAEAKKQLLSTAGQYDGPFAACVESYVQSVENGDWPISMADKEMRSQNFAPETRTAYKIWRDAYAAKK
jgi:hypothetical protein